MRALVELVYLFATISASVASPIFLKGNSPSGDTVIAISSSDPNIERYLTLNFNNSENDEDSSSVPQNPTDQSQRTFSTALAGTNTSTGRNFGSFNPFFLPFFNFPLSFDGLGLSKFRPNQARGMESYEPSYNGNGELKTITAVNDNGHVYGKVKTVTFDSTKNSQ